MIDGGGRAADPPSRGTHLLLDRDRLDRGRGLHRPGRRGAEIFALPWYGRTLVGTTDNDFEGDIDHPPPARTTSSTCSTRSTPSSAPTSAMPTWSAPTPGVRPLISSGDPRKSVDISRRAELYETSSGMLTITGGKLTTWRRMAKQTVDRMVEREGREAPCHTAEIPLGMAARDRRTWRRPRGSRTRRVAQLAFRYGHAARNVLDLAGEQPEAGAADRPGPPRPARRGGDRRPARAGALASPTSCCGAPGSGWSRRRSCATRTRSAVADALGEELGWSRRVKQAAARAWPAAAAEAGIDPALDG